MDYMNLNYWAMNGPPPSEHAGKTGLADQVREHRVGHH